MKAEMVLLVYVVVVVAGPLHLDTRCLHRCLHLKTSTSQAAESAGGESTKSQSQPFPFPDERGVVTHHHCPILFTKSITNICKNKRKERTKFAYI